MSLANRLTGQEDESKNECSNVREFQMHGTGLDRGHSSVFPEKPTTGTVFLDGGSGVFNVEYLAPVSIIHM